MPFCSVRGILCSSVGTIVLNAWFAPKLSLYITKFRDSKIKRRKDRTYSCHRDNLDIVQMTPGDGEGEVAACVIDY